MRGKFVILAILSPALVATGFGIWFKRQMTCQVLELLGPRAVQRVALPTHVDYLELQALAGSGHANHGETLTLPDTQIGIIRRFDISGAAGLLHLKHALLQDASYDWHASTDGSPTWQYALQFTDDQDHTTFLLDLNQRHVLILERDRRAVLGTKINEGLKAYLAELVMDGIGSSEIHFLRPEFVGGGKYFGRKK